MFSDKALSTQWFWLLYTVCLKLSLGCGKQNSWTTSTSVINKRRQVLRLEPPVLRQWNVLTETKDHKDSKGGASYQFENDVSVLTASRPQSAPTARPRRPPAWRSSLSPTSAFLKSSREPRVSLPRRHGLYPYAPPILQLSNRRYRSSTANRTTIGVATSGGDQELWTALNNNSDTYWDASVRTRKYVLDKVGHLDTAALSDTDDLSAISFLEKKALRSHASRSLSSKASFSNTAEPPAPSFSTEVITATFNATEYLTIESPSNVSSEATRKEQTSTTLIGEATPKKADLTLKSGASVETRKESQITGDVQMALGLPSQPTKPPTATRLRNGDLQRPVEAVVPLELAPNHEKRQQKQIQTSDASTLATNRQLREEEVGIKTSYYLIDLRPFSILVQADRDLTTDLGIPLYLLLEMGETLTTLVDIKITNLTVRTGIEYDEHEIHSGRHSFLRERAQSTVKRWQDQQQVEHYHWNELFYHGLAQFNDAAVYPPLTVQNVQSLVLSDRTSIQNYWDDQGFGESYTGLELINISLLEIASNPPATVPDSPMETYTVAETLSTSPSGAEATSQSFDSEPEHSKRQSNVWVIVPLVLLFLLVCFCIITLAGRLRYLGSRAQEKYNEKYGLDYNVYNKDIGKDIFKEEHLMSEHNDDPLFLELNNSVGVPLNTAGLRSIDHLARPVGSFNAARRSVSRKGKMKFQETGSIDNEEKGRKLHGISSELVSSEVDEYETPICRTIKRKLSENSNGNDSKAVGDSVSTAQDEDRLVVPGEPIEEIRLCGRSQDAVGNIRAGECLVLDNGLACRTMASGEDASDELSAAQQQKNAGTLICEGEEATRRSTGTMFARKRAGENRVGTDEFRGKERSSLLSPSIRMASSSSMEGMEAESNIIRFQQSVGSFTAGHDEVIMGNSIRGSREDRDPIFNPGLVCSVSAFREEPGIMGSSSRGERSARSTLSVRSMESASSMGSFYSCQGDIV